MNSKRFKVHFRFSGPYNASGEWKGVMGDVVMGRYILDNFAILQLYSTESFFFISRTGTK